MQVISTIFIDNKLLQESSSNFRKISNLENPLLWIAKLTILQEP
jgi:hypothetical protein